MPNSTTHPIIERSPQLWFADGDIVIKTRCDNGNILCYKLRRDVLAVHAPVFLESLDDILAREKDTMDNTPAVLLPETECDTDWFLHAIHHPSSLLRWKYQPKSFKRTLPLYKMALKYKVDYITDVLSGQLEQDWPKNIWEWDAYESDDALYIKGGRWNYTDMNPEPVAAIRFAREANLPSILPAAFYQLSTINTECEFDERAWKGLRLFSDRRCARWSELTKEDLLCLAAGRDNLASFLRKIHSWFTALIPLEPEHSKCREAWTLMPPLKSNDILRDLQELCKPNILPGAFMCKPCRDKMNEKAREEREGIWKLLPLFFRLPEPR